MRIRCRKRQYAEYRCKIKGSRVFYGEEEEVVKFSPSLAFSIRTAMGLSPLPVFPSGTVFQTLFAT